MAVTLDSANSTASQSAGVDHQRAGGVAGRLQLGQRLAQRGQDRRRVCLGLDSAGAVDIREHLGLDGKSQPVPQLVGRRTSPG